MPKEKITQAEDALLAVLKRKSAYQPVELFDLLVKQNFEDSVIRAAFWHLMGQNKIVFTGDSQVSAAPEVLEKVV